MTKRTFASISPEHHALAKELTKTIFKKHGQPKGVREGPQFAIHEGLRLLSECVAGKIIPVEAGDYEALRHAVLKRAATTQVMEMLATTAAVSGLLLQNNVGQDAATRQANSLDQKAVEEFADMILVQCLNRVAVHVLEAEHDADGDEQKAALLRLAGTLTNDAQIVTATTKINQGQHVSDATH